MEKTNNLIKPLFDRVLLRPESDQKSNGGIIIPRESADRSYIMKVAAVGECKTVCIGDRVIVAKYAGTDVTLGGEKYTLVTEYDILGKVQ